MQPDDGVKSLRVLQFNIYRVSQKILPPPPPMQIILVRYCTYGN